MNNYEIIKEAKLVYQYIGDLLDNANLEMNGDIEDALKTTMSAMSDIYTNTHTLMSNDKEESKLLRTDLDCPKCPAKVEISDLIDYEYVCNGCDENYYSIEGNLGEEWYKEDKNSLKLDENFIIEVDYDSEEQNVMISSENSSGAKYNCKNVNDLKKAIDYYATNYLTNEIIDEDIYVIQFWETDHDRDQGFASQFLEKFKDSKQAVKMAKSLMRLHDYSCVEVINERNNFAVFNKDKESESTYFYHRYYNRIFKVSPEQLQEYVENWTDKKGHKYDYDLLYCENSDGSYTAVDDSDGQCWTEDFDTEAQAVFWLDTYIPVEEIKTTIIPKDVLERVYDMTKDNSKEIERD